MRVFRLPFLRFWMPLASMAVVGSIAFSGWLFSFENGTFLLKSLFSAVTFLTVLGAESALAYFAWIIIKVYVSDLGIRCANYCGQSRFVAWDDITSVKPIMFLGFRYLRIYDRTTRWPLWLPYGMAKQKLFWPFLLKLVDSSSPLASAIREARLA